MFVKQTLQQVFTMEFMQQPYEIGASSKLKTKSPPPLKDWWWGEGGVILKFVFHHMGAGSDNG